MAARYQQGRALPAEVLDRWASAVSPYLPSGPIRVVDVGAGTGIFAAAWPRWTTAAVVAVEPAAAMVRANSVEGPAVSFVLGTAEPYRSGTAAPNVPRVLRLRAAADVVWVSTALHHFADVHHAVREFARVLGHGGRVLVRTFVPSRPGTSWLDEFRGRAKWDARLHTEQQLTEHF